MSWYIIIWHANAYQREITKRNIVYALFLSLFKLVHDTVLQNADGLQFYWFASKAAILHSWKYSFGFLLTKNHTLNMIEVAY